TIVGQIDQSQTLRASSLVGHGVMVSGNKIAVFRSNDGKDATTDKPDDGDITNPNIQDEKTRQKMGMYKAENTDSEPADDKPLFSTP
ncbi:flagellar biosynthesis protein FlgD, partial [Enterococcus hirae]